MNSDFSILFEDLTSVETTSPMAGCMVWCVGWWVGSNQITKIQINLDLIEIIQFWTFWTFLLKPLQPFTGLFIYSFYHGVAVCIKLGFHIHFVPLQKVHLFRNKLTV